ncbi:MAG TPA: glycosyltransferase family 9 protein [Rhodospirillales bacterium]
MRILFITSSRIGDAVLSTALLAHLIERYPQARITLACGPAAAPLFEAVPGLERLIALPKRPYGGHWLSLWAATVGIRWDLVVDLRASILAWMVWARERRVFRYNHALGHRLRQLASVFGLDPPPSPKLWTAPRHDDTAARLIPAGTAVLALGPTANWPRKAWAAARFAELALRLTAPAGILPNARIAVFGGPGERKAAMPVIEGLPADRVIDLVGRVDLLTVYACLRRCAFFIGNDSGLMHVAAAAGIPTLGLFGPSKEHLYAPWGDLAAAARTPERYDQLVGGPGYDRFAPGSLMDGLTVDTVERAARDLWARARKGAST